jgi:TetR/AcrR family transcriptional regulator, fatty acid metabolism regulator protein
MRPIQASGLADDERSFIETARRAQIVAAAIDTIAELGYAQASLARIAQRIGVSKGVISYYFAAKDDLVRAVMTDVIAKALAYVRPRLEAESSGPGKLRAAIESNIAFMGEYRPHMVAFFQIVLNTRGADSTPNPAVARVLQDGAASLRELLATYQAADEFRAGFDPQVMATAIRAAIDAVPRKLAAEPDFDVGHYGRELADLFDVATRGELPDPGRSRE